MIYLKTLSQTYSLLERTSVSQSMDYVPYHLPFTDSNYGIPLGLTPQELTVQLRLVDLSVPFQDVIYVSFDNITWQKVIAIKLDFSLPFAGAHYPLVLRIVVSPLKLGIPHASGDMWGLDSVLLEQEGNHMAYAKLVYYAPRFYFPLMQSLVDFAGSSIAFTNASSKNYGGVSYPANTPIFDEGLVITSNDVASLNITSYVSGTLLLKIKYKGQSLVNPRTILITDDFELQLDRIQQTINLLKGGVLKLSVIYLNDAYENGRTYFIGIKWDADNTYLAVAFWDDINLTFDSGSLQTASDAFTITFGDSYLGSNGTSQWLGDSISDFVLYDYEVF